MRERATSRGDKQDKRAKKRGVALDLHFASRACKKTGNVTEIMRDGGEDVKGREPEARSQKPGARSQEQEVRSKKEEVRSKK